MKRTLALGPLLLTLTAVAAAGFVTQRLWDYYMHAPWTRDGRVQADVIQVAPDVSGLVSQLLVRDNQQVHKGQPLLVIDQARYQLAVQEAEALVAERRARLQQAKREDQRNRRLHDLVSTEEVEAGETAVQQNAAALATAEAALAVAQLNLTRTTVLSPVDGYLSDRTVRVGDYVHTGNPLLSVVDTGSLRVVGYFEETRLPKIAVGQPVEIQLMGESQLLHGHVDSIAAGIEDRDRRSGNSLLPDIDPSFDWVRLAQRIPVRVTLDDKPSAMQLVVGRTATLSVLEQPAPQPHTEQVSQ